MEDAHFFLQPKVLVDKKPMLSETGKIKIKEALEALEKKEIKEYAYCLSSEKVMPEVFTQA